MKVFMTLYFTKDLAKKCFLLKLLNFKWLYAIILKKYSLNINATNDDIF